MRLFSSLTPLRLIASLVLSLSVAASGQDDLFHVYEQHGVETIDLSSLDIRLDIPIYTKQQAGGPLTISYKFDNQKVWTEVEPNANPVNLGPWTWLMDYNRGWSAGGDNKFGYITVNSVVATDCDYNWYPIVNSAGEDWFVVGDGRGPPEWTYSAFTYTDQYGNAHDFPISFQHGPCGDNLNSSATVDGYTLTFPDASITSPSGTVYYPPVYSMGAPDFSSKVSSGSDSNGNTTTITQTAPYSSGRATYTYYGGAPLVESVVDTSGSTVLTGTEVDFPSSSQAAVVQPQQITYSYTDSNGTPQSTVLTYKLYNINTGFGCGVAGSNSITGPFDWQGLPLSTHYNGLDASTSVQTIANVPGALLDRITYANGTFYQFTYEPTPGQSGYVTGRLGSLTLPTGGTITYSYPGANDGISCADLAETGLRACSRSSE